VTLGTYALGQQDPVIGLQAVQHAIAAACARAGRDPQSVTLIAASKTVTGDVIESAISAGHRAFGENRVSEARAKWPSVRSRFADTQLHLIGPLQANKVNAAVTLFDAIHSVDRPRLCEALSRHCEMRGRQPTLFVQVNTGAEPQKAGVMPGEADRFLAACRDVYGLGITGLMCIPPASEPPEPHFQLLAKIAARNGLHSLSMGMSADFATAMELGATHVRVGRAIFGARERDVT
jgi:PLP dependent protein